MCLVDSDQPSIAAVHFAFWSVACIFGSWKSTTKPLSPGLRERWPVVFKRVGSGPAFLRARRHLVISYHFPVGVIGSTNKGD